MTSYKDRDGVLYEFIRDEKGNLREYRINRKVVYSQDVNEKGLIEKRIVYGQNDIVTEYEYYGNGNLEYQICDGVKTEYEYDSRNRVTKITVAGKVVTEYEYIGRNVIQRDYNGLETIYITNGRKDMTEVIQTDTVTGVIHKTRIEYDRRHLPLKVYNGDGQTETLVTSYLYTPEGKIKAQVSHGKENWITLYDYEHGEIHEVKQFKTLAVVEPVETTLFEALLSKLLIKTGEDVYIQKYDRKIQGENQTEIEGGIIVEKYRRIILLFFFVWFGIRLCYVMINLLLIKKRIKTFGEKVYLLPNLLDQKEKLLHITFISSISIIVIAIFLIIILREWLLLSCIFFSVSMIIRTITVKKLSENNGIYEKGIILGMFIKYKKIQSYEILNDDKINLIFKNGQTLNLTITEKRDEIIKIFEINKISLIHN